MKLARQPSQFHGNSRTESVAHAKLLTIFSNQKLSDLSIMLVNTAPKSLRNLLLMAIGILTVALLVGAIIGVVTTPKPPNFAVPSVSSGIDSQPPNISATATRVSSSDSLPPDIVAIDMARLIAAHPWTDSQESYVRERHADALTSTDKDFRESIIQQLEAELRASRKMVVRDIQRIIAAYAATNNVTMVLDRSAFATKADSILLYSSNDADFQKLLAAQGVKNITPQIMQELAKQRPNSVERGNLR